jgi:hypothetical protein
MAQTDRQTDKATHWQVTAYDQDILRLEDASGYPVYVKKVYGGREKCPTTGREHFQGHIVLRTQQRLSAIKKWLPTAHLEVARNFNASIQYALKTDTASGEKSERANPTAFVTNRSALEKLVEQAPYKICEDEDTEKEDYWQRVRKILLDEPDLCGLYGKPDLYRLWRNTKSVWFERARRAREGFDSITQSPIAIENRNIIISPDNINGTQVINLLQAQSSEEADDQGSDEDEGCS